MEVEAEIRLDTESDLTLDLDSWVTIPITLYILGPESVTGADESFDANSCEGPASSEIPDKCEQWDEVDGAVSKKRLRDDAEVCSTATTEAAVVRNGLQCDNEPSNAFGQQQNKRSKREPEHRGLNSDTKRKAVSSLENGREIRIQENESHPVSLNTLEENLTVLQSKGNLQSLQDSYAIVAGNPMSKLGSENGKGDCSEDLLNVFQNKAKTKQIVSENLASLQRPKLTQKLSKKKQMKSLRSSHVRQARVNKDGRLYKCTHCKATYNMLSHLNGHLQVHRRQKKLVSSQRNHKETNRTKFKEQLLDQVKKEQSDRNGNDISSLSCKLCSFAPMDLSILTHMKKHGSKKPYRCSECDYSTSKSHTFKKHVYKKHIDQTPPSNYKSLQCKHCEYSAVDLDSFTEHMRIHSGGTPIKHNQCDSAPTTAGFKPLPDSDVSRCEKHINIINVTKTVTPVTTSKRCGRKSNLHHHTNHDKQTNSQTHRYKCEMCNFSTRFRSLLLVHNRKHTSEKPYRCDQHRSFCVSTNLSQHKTIDLRDDYNCKKCNSSKMVKKLEVRMPIHTEDQPYKCNMCDSAFHRPNLLSRHKKMHLNIKCHKCKMCDYSTTEPSYLKVHMQSHDNERPYKCSVCDSAFRRSSHLCRHKKIHLDLKPYKCEICNYATRDADSLKIHERIHKDERPYKCDVCDSTFQRSSHLCRHKRIHLDLKPYKCKICKYSTRVAESLKIHERIHKDERPYKCDVCDSTFRTSSSLCRHKRIHSDWKPYKCKICKYSTRDAHTLKIHEQIHTEERRYKCDVCDSAFRTSSHLCRHRKIHSDLKQ
ncbi:zinc finger protein 678 isoform X2 [Latimeria chalumnae]|uniref:zinc finger protein 678 isoform X2 n=1 Tax=Latimeria chalumnae TaxID=7897 RepID=UPI0003C1AE8B|nr:PREDICTED: zinc finger protein 678-like isoform X2 [Latimeria chalumnae]|eukprot:XP_006000984.1 PREDICTED: zinc finger protein 678-like isoform X2 [Latimeria chalumnae]